MVGGAEAGGGDSVKIFAGGMIERNAAVLAGGVDEKAHRGLFRDERLALRVRQRKSARRFLDDDVQPIGADVDGKIVIADQAVW
jgi:hypothetical protein